ncbi:hypothetical protein Tco_1542775, partial [Tanacetum coccineum]
KRLTERWSDSKEESVLCMDDLRFVETHASEESVVSVSGSSFENISSTRMLSGSFSSTDIAKISRKRSKPDNHVHGKEEYTKSRENAIKSQQWSTQVNLQCTKEAQGCHITDCHAGNPCELRFDLMDHNGDPIIGRNEELGLMGSCNKLWT